MSLHGIPQNEIDKIRAKFKNETEDINKDIRIPLSQFKNMGLAFGRPNKTVIIRPKDKK